MAAYWKTHRLKGHEKLIFVGYFSFKIEVLTDFKFTKNKDLTKRAVWAGAWDKTLYHSTKLSRDFRETNTSNVSYIFPHLWQIFNGFFGQLSFPQSYKAQGRSWRWENLFEKIIFTSFSLITYTISRPLHDQWPRLHEIKNRKGSKFKDNRPVVVPFSSRVIGKLHASFFENAERDLGRVANPKDNRNELWCSPHCPPPRPNQKLQVTATRRIANSSRLHIRVTIWPGLLKAGWR